ncbi:microtubule-associated protein [Caerostris darwini]|uniref:Microtubule-associated protein n=1 Tax=Caerostris darwini TaxID=1538125 RepID=A0AAV4T0W4_9ARAC|nr:microtubule-associated protein [Caerostris darwini]
MNNENEIDHTTIEEVAEPQMKMTKALEFSALPGKQSEFILEKDLSNDNVSQSSFPETSKVISPRKGIKVEEDEIETAISSVQFYDEVNETIELLSEKESEENQTLCIVKDSNLEPTAELVDSRDIEADLGQANQEISVQETENVPEKPSMLLSPSKQIGGEEKIASEGARTPSSISPKKKKKKRKATRSRSTSQKGTTSATKKAQDLKPSTQKTNQTEKAPSRTSSSTTSRNASAVEKKLPPIKAPVGNAPPPKVKNVKSKIGSLDNVTHKPKGGEKKVESVKLEWNVKSKVGSLDHATHKPGGGDKKIITQKVDFKNVTSKIGSKDNLKHKPGGGNLKIATEKLDFKAKAASKVGSLDNAKHKPGGGNVQIKSEKLHFKEKATPKIISRSGSEKGSSHGGSEIGSPVPPSSPAPPENMPPLCEDENSVQEDKLQNDDSPQEDDKSQKAVSPQVDDKSQKDASPQSDDKPKEEEKTQEEEKPQEGDKSQEEEKPQEADKPQEGAPQVETTHCNGESANHNEIATAPVYEDISSDDEPPMINGHAEEHC